MQLPWGPEIVALVGLTVYSREFVCRCQSYMYIAIRDEHNGHVLYTRSSVMDTMDMCYTCHILSLFILSLYFKHSCHCLPKFYKYSVSTVYVSFCLLYSLAIFCFCLLLFQKTIFLNHYIYKPSEYTHWMYTISGYASKAYLVSVT